jgi:hypothetical protein
MFLRFPEEGPTPCRGCVNFLKLLPGLAIGFQVYVGKQGVDVLRWQTSMQELGESVESAVGGTRAAGG